MKLSLEINQAIEELEVIVRAKERNAEVEDLLARIENQMPEQDFFLAYDEDEVILIAKKEVNYFFSSNKKVYVNSVKGVFEIRKRLYQLEGSDRDFVRISNTDIVNINAIDKIDLKYSGTIMIMIKNGDSLYVSRRYLPKVRQAFGIGG